MCRVSWMLRILPSRLWDSDCKAFIILTLSTCEDGDVSMVSKLAKRDSDSTGADDRKTLYLYALADITVRAD